MAVLNSTETRVLPVSQSSAVSRSKTAELEKISCSLDRYSVSELVQLVGRRVLVSESLTLMPGEVADSCLAQVYRCKVLSVCFGSASDGVISSLSLLQEGYEFPNDVDLTDLVLLDAYP